LSRTKQIQKNNQETSVTNKTNVSPSEPTANEIALTEIAADNLAGTNLAVKYPKSWQIAHDSFGPEDTVVSERYSISSPNNKIKVKFVVSNAGFGGTCEDVDGDEIQYINIRTFANP